MEVLFDGGDEDLFGAQWVEVVDAQQDLAVCRAGPVVRQEEGRGVTEVKRACGGWGEAAGVHFKLLVLSC